MNDALDTLRTRAANGESPDSIEITVDDQYDPVLVVTFGIDRYAGERVRISLDEFDDVTNDRDALDTDVLSGDDALLLSITLRDGIVSEKVGLNLLHGYHDRGARYDDLFAEYYSIGEDFVQDTQHTAWHLNQAHDSDERHLLLE